MNSSLVKREVLLLGEGRGYVKFVLTCSKGPYLYNASMYNVQQYKMIKCCEWVLVIYKEIVQTSWNFKLLGQIAKPPNACNNTRFGSNKMLNLS